MRALVKAGDIEAFSETVEAECDNLSSKQLIPRVTCDEFILIRARLWDLFEGDPLNEDYLGWMHVLNKICEAKIEPTIKEKQMSDNTGTNAKIPANPKAPAFETRHYIFGQEISTIPDESLITAIRKIEGEIDALKEVRTKSTKVATKIKELEEMLKKVVEVLDARP